MQPEILQMNVPHLLIRKCLYASVIANRMITHVYEIQDILGVTPCHCVTVSQYSFEMSGSTTPVTRCHTWILNSIALKTKKLSSHVFVTSKCYPTYGCIFFYTFVWPCSLTNFFIIKPTRCTNFTNLFCRETLHVSDSSSVHHQEFIHCTLSNCICHTGL